MKYKILSLFVVASLLVGCDNPFAKRDDFQTVVKTHFSALSENVSSAEFDNFVGTTHMETQIAAKSKAQDFAATITGDGKQKGADLSSIVLNLNGSVTVPPAKPITAKGTLSVITTTGTGYLRFDNLEVGESEENPFLGSIVKSMTQQYGNKWMYISNASGLDTTGSINQKAIREAVKNHPVFTMTKDLGYKDGQYHYEVALNKPEMLELEKALKVAMTGTGLTTEEIEATRKELESTTLNGTFSVDNSERQYGAFNGTYTVTDGTGATAKTESGNISYENTKDSFKFDVTHPEGKLALVINKHLTQVDGTLTVTDKAGKTTPVQFTIEKTLDGYSYHVTTDIVVTNGDKVALKVDGKLSMKKDESVKIDIPTDAKDIKTILGGMFGVPISSTSMAGEGDEAGE